MPEDPELPEGVREYGSSSEDPDARNRFLGSELLRTWLGPLPLACCVCVWEATLEPSKEKIYKYKLNTQIK